MNIAFFAPRFHSNQVGLVNELLRQGHNVKFYVLHIGSSENYTCLSPILLPKSSIMKCYHFKDSTDSPRIFEMYIPSLRFLCAQLFANKFDAIVFRGIHKYLYFYQLLMLRFIFQFKLVTYTQGSVYVDKIDITTKIVSFIVRRVIRIGWISPVLYRNYSVNLKRKDFMFFIPFVTSFDSFRLGIPISDRNLNDYVVITSVGKFEPRKGFEELILAFKNLFIRFDNRLVLRLVGSTSFGRDQYFNNLVSFVRKLDLDHCVEFIRDVDHNSMPSILISTDIFVLNSRNESASIANVEALSFGIPVICRADNGTSYTVTEGFNGCKLSDDPRSVQDVLSFSIDRFLDGSYSKEEIFKSYSNLFSSELTVKRFIAYISK
jgi:glycosyltransferase involved in cell wall biosynthesis